MIDLCEKCGLPITNNDCLFRGDRKVEHSPREECIRLAKEEITHLREIIQAHLHQRKCHDCGCVFWAADGVVPYCLCEGCGSQDTRRVKT